MPKERVKQPIKSRSWINNVCLLTVAMASLTAQTHSHLGIGMRKKTKWTKGKEKLGKDWVAIFFVKFQMCWYHVTFDLELEHTLDAGLPGDDHVQVWSQSGHLRARRSDFRASTKVPISRDLWPWSWTWAHPGCRLNWRPSCASLVAIRPFVCEKKRFAQKFRRTDRQTDGQTTDASPWY